MKNQQIIEKFRKKFVQYDNEGVVVGGFEESPYTRIEEFILEALSSQKAKIDKTTENVIATLAEINNFERKQELLIQKKKWQKEIEKEINNIDEREFGSAKLYRVLCNLLK